MRCSNAVCIVSVCGISGGGETSTLISCLEKRGGQARLLRFEIRRKGKTTMKRMIMGVMMGALLTGTASYAQIRQRQENQQDRIGEGVENGSLTPKETSQLEHQETRLNQEIRRDRKA